MASKSTPVKSKSTWGKQESPSPVTITATGSTTPSPRTPVSTPRPQMTLSLQKPADLDEVKRQEMREANIHPTLQDEWWKSREKDRSYWRERSDRMNKTANAGPFTVDPIDLPAEYKHDPKSSTNYKDNYFNSDRMRSIKAQDKWSDKKKERYIAAEKPTALITAEGYEPSNAFKKIKADDEEREAYMGNDTDDWYGGRNHKKGKSRKTRKTRKTRKSRKTRKPRKSKKSKRKTRKPRK